MSSFGLANRNNAILSAQLPIYQQFMPKFHDGGVYNSPSVKPKVPPCCVTASSSSPRSSRRRAATQSTSGSTASRPTLASQDGSGKKHSQLRLKARTGNHGPKFLDCGASLNGRVADSFRRHRDVTSWRPAQPSTWPRRHRPSGRPEGQHLRRRLRFEGRTRIRSRAQNSEAGSPPFSSGRPPPPRFGMRLTTFRSL